MSEYDTSVEQPIGTLYEPQTGYYHIIEPAFIDYFFAEDGSSTHRGTLFTRPELCGNVSMFPFIYDRVKKGLSVSLDWHLISNNTHPLATKLMREPEHLRNIRWTLLSANPCPEAFALLFENQDKIDWTFLSSNEYDGAVDLLERHIDKINWACLCRNRNPRAISLLANHPEKVNLAILSQTHTQQAVALLSTLTRFDEAESLGLFWALSANPYAMDILEKHVDKICWETFSTNPHQRTIDLLLQNPTKMNFKQLSTNTNPNALRLLESHLDKVDWSSLSANPSAIGLLEKHLDDVDLSSLLFNPSICRIV